MMKKKELRADMFLPDFLMAFGVFLIVGGIVGLIVCLIIKQMLLSVIAGVCLILGIAAVLCWKNQTITILSEDSFAYKTFLGKQYTYYFQDIKELSRKTDSWVLIVGNRKVHIESMAVISERLLEILKKYNAEFEAKTIR